MKTLLKNISSIQTGLFAKPSGDGELVYLQLKHFDENGKLNTDLHPDLKVEVVSEKHLLKNGDVLFASKGSKNFAAVFESHNLPSVASTSFFVIRLKNNKVLPHFLAWILNGNDAQLTLKNQAIGSSIPSISKQVLENFEIIIPNINIQMTILEIALLRNKEKSLKLKIEKLREKQIQQKILEAISYE